MPCACPISWSICCIADCELLQLREVDRLRGSSPCSEASCASFWSDLIWLLIWLERARRLEQVLRIIGRRRTPASAPPPARRAERTPADGQRRGGDDAERDSAIASSLSLLLCLRGWELVEQGGGPARGRARRGSGRGSLLAACLEERSIRRCEAGSEAPQSASAIWPSAEVEQAVAARATGDNNRAWASPARSARSAAR